MNVLILSRDAFVGHVFLAEIDLSGGEWTLFLAILGVVVAMMAFVCNMYVNKLKVTHKEEIYRELSEHKSKLVDKNNSSLEFIGSLLGEVEVLKKDYEELSREYEEALLARQDLEGNVKQDVQGTQKQIKIESKLVSNKLTDIEAKIKKYRDGVDALNEPLNLSKEGEKVLIIFDDYYCRLPKASYRKSLHYKKYFHLLKEVCLGNDEIAASLVEKHKDFAEIIKLCGYNLVFEEDEFIRLGVDTVYDHWNDFSVENILRLLRFRYMEGCFIARGGKYIKVNSFTIKRLNEMHEKLRLEAKFLAIKV